MAPDFSFLGGDDTGGDAGDEDVGEGADEPVGVEAAGDGDAVEAAGADGGTDAPGAWAAGVPESQPAPRVSATTAAIVVARALRTGRV